MRMTAAGVVSFPLSRISMIDDDVLALQDHGTDGHVCSRSECPVRMPRHRMSRPT